MLFAILCDDKPGALETRKATRADHLEHLRGLGETLKFAGPFLNEADQTPCGSMLVVEADSTADAQAIADADPYAKAGLFAAVTIRPWAWTVNNPDA